LGRTWRRRFVIVIAIVAGGFMAGLTRTSSAATYTGSLTAPGVAWISDGSKPAPLPEAEMRNTHKSFVPDLLVITAGTSVRFPNDDPFFHSIYSAIGPDPFDIGFYDNGPGKVVAFPNPGVVVVRCHIHGTMHASIIVVDGPWSQTHVPNQTYTLTGVRGGTHILHTWSRDDGEKTQSLQL
jgi:plastocyanin